MAFDTNVGNSFFKSTMMLRQIKYNSNPIKQAAPPPPPEPSKEENFEIDFSSFRAAKAGINNNGENGNIEAENTAAMNKPAVSFVEQNNS